MRALLLAVGLLLGASLVAGFAQTGDPCGASGRGRQTVVDTVVHDHAVRITICVEEH